MVRTGYKNNQANTVFTEYIAKEQQILLNEKLVSRQTNKEEELHLVLYFDPYTDDGKVHICSKFLLFINQRMVQQQACMNLLQEPFIIWM